jgi:hypothetical protein
VRGGCHLDLGMCVTAQPEYGFGPRCDSRVFDAKLDPCGAYGCVQDRCRSCQGDAQCGSADERRCTGGNRENRSARQSDQ